MGWNAACIPAMAAATPEAVLAFTMNGELLRNKVKLALAEWANAGHRRDVDTMNAFIDQTGQQSLLLWKADVLDRLEKCRLHDPLAGDFLFTTLIPGNFLADTAGWPEFTYSHKEAEKHTSETSTKLNLKGGFGIGSFKLGAEGDYTKDVKKEIETLNDFSVKFKISQIPLSRPWFDPTFLESRAWRLREGAVEVGELSDGKVPPTGMLPAYPTSVIFIKDLEVSSSDIKKSMSEVKSHLAAGGSVGWGSFSLGGKYQRDNKTFDSRIEETATGFKVAGLSILGFRCHMIKKSPDPLPEIKDFE
ncbi:MAG: hypothetical protein R3B70_40970 [Polyangiaceae bacterium]